MFSISDFRSLVHNVKSKLEPISAVGVAAEREQAMKYIDSTLRKELAVLGLAADADRDAVIHAYRRLAKESHPDLTAAQDAAARFDAVTAAYRHVLDLVPARTAEAVPHVIHQVVVSRPLSFYLPDASLTPRRRGPPAASNRGRTGPNGAIADAPAHLRRIHRRANR